MRVIHWLTIWKVKDNLLVCKIIEACICIYYILGEFFCVFNDHAAAGSVITEIDASTSTSPVSLETGPIPKTSTGAAVESMF